MKPNNSEPLVSAREPQPILDQIELDKLAHSLAFEFAVSVLDGDGITMRDDDDEAWQMVDPDGEVDLFDCLRYLEARGLIERHPEHSGWVRVRDESEAAR